MSSAAIARAEGTRRAAGISRSTRSSRRCPRCATISACCPSAPRPTTPTRLRPRTARSYAHRACPRGSAAVAPSHLCTTIRTTIYSLRWWATSTSACMRRARQAASTLDPASGATPRRWTSTRLIRVLTLASRMQSTPRPCCERASCCTSRGCTGTMCARSPLLSPSPSGGARAWASGAAPAPMPRTTSRITSVMTCTRFFSPGTPFAYTEPLYCRSEWHRRANSSSVRGWTGARSVGGP
mmetsp:Transcript_5755/g.12588  ORF Transcript_5755/g.12588 Transcript_5755/m.12588 type:complete len:240 (-) Transcript_5755:181-900(-)